MLAILPHNRSLPLPPHTHSDRMSEFVGIILIFVKYTYYSGENLHFVLYACVENKFMQEVTTGENTNANSNQTSNL